MRPRSIKEWWSKFSLDELDRFPQSPDLFHIPHLCKEEEGWMQADLSLKWSFVWMEAIPCSEQVRSIVKASPADAHDCPHTFVHGVKVMCVCMCVSAVNSSWTTFCLSTANLLCSNGALSSAQGVDVFRSLSAGLTGAWECLQPSSGEVSQLDMHPPPTHHIHSHTHTWKGNKDRHLYRRGLTHKPKSALCFTLS